MDYKSLSLADFFKCLPISSEEQQSEDLSVIYDSPYIIPTYIEIAYDHLHNTLRLQFRYLNQEDEYEEIIDDIKIYFGKNSKKIQRISLSAKIIERDVEDVCKLLNQSQGASRDSLNLIKSIIMNQKIQENIKNMVKIHEPITI